jgi:hypothetical protein
MWIPTSRNGRRRR